MFGCEVAEPATARAPVSDFNCHGALYACAAESQSNNALSLLMAMCLSVRSFELRQVSVRRRLELPPSPPAALNPLSTAFLHFISISGERVAEWHAAPQFLSLHIPLYTPPPLAHTRGAEASGIKQASWSLCNKSVRGYTCVCYNFILATESAEKVGFLWFTLEIIICSCQFTLYLKRLFDMLVECWEFSNSSQVLEKILLLLKFATYYYIK